MSISYWYFASIPARASNHQALAFIVIFLFVSRMHQHFPHTHKSPPRHGAESWERERWIDLTCLVCLAYVIA